MNIVLDTNVLVSALWSADSKPAAVISAVLARHFTACYDCRILDEYNNVRHRPKFGFQEWEINALLDPIVKYGLIVIPQPISDVCFVDENDKKFYEVAKFCDALVVTGNIKHYLQDSSVITVAEFYEKYLR